MEPFSISCTTCQARLRVQDESAIGQILACPKCGSMVLIQRPAEAAGGAGISEPSPPPAQPSQSPPQSSPQNTPPPAASTKPDTGPTVPVPPAAPEVASRKPTVEAAPDEQQRPKRKFKFREDFQEGVDAPAPARKNAPVTPAPPRVASAQQRQDRSLEGDEGHEQAQTTASMPPAGRGLAVRRYQQWLLISAAGIVGIGMALLVVGLLSSKGSAGASPTPEEVETGSHDEAVKPVDAAEKAHPTSDSPSLAGQDATAQESQPADDGVPSDPETEQADASHADPAPPNGEEPGDAHFPAMPSEPAKGPVHADTTPSTDRVGEMPADLEDAADDARVSAPPADTADGIMRSRLMFPFVAMEFQAEDEVSLADFCSFLSRATSVPVTLDVDALRAAGLTSEAFVACELRGVTAEQALAAVLEPWGLSFSVEESGLTVTSPTANELSTREYDVTDLAEDDAQTAALSAWLTSMVDPPTWEGQGGEGALSATASVLEIQQRGITHYRLARFLDRLRIARGLLPRTELPPDDISLTPAFIRLTENLNLTVSASFARPTPLQDILDHLQVQADLRILPDWHALIESGVQPSQELSPGLTEQPLHTVLKELLPPLKMDYRAVDGSSLQITSLAALENLFEVEFYPIINGSDLDERKLLAEIQARVGEPYFTPEGGTGAMVYDPASKCLIVSLPQLQQRLVATWLATNRKTDFGLRGER